MSTDANDDATCTSCSTDAACMLTREDSQPKYECIIDIGLVETKHINT